MGQATEWSSSAEPSGRDGALEVGGPPRGHEVAIVSPNPTLDFVYEEPAHQFSDKSFYRRVSVVAGGSGFNVARALRSLGLEATVVVALGGWAGRLAGEMATEEGLKIQVVEGGETRVTAVECSPRGKHMVVAPSPGFEPSIAQALAEVAEPIVARAQVILFGGSFPAEARDQERLAELLAQHAERLFVDTRGPMLSRLLELRPYCARVDATSLPLQTPRASHGRGRRRLRRVLEEARRFHRSGVRLVCTEGRRRLYATFGGRTYSYPQFGSPVHRTFGRGDAFMAGLLAAFLRGSGPDRSVRMGIAAGQSAGRPGSGLGSIDMSLFGDRLDSAGRIRARRVR